MAIKNMNKPTMKLYAVRIQSDIREDQSKRYSEYPSADEYNLIWRPDIENRIGLQNGFHECVNFKDFEGEILGYLPPKPGHDSDWIDDDEMVCFVFVTNKSRLSKKRATELGLYDTIVGIQVGCQMVWGESDDEWFWFERDDVPPELQKYLDNKCLEHEQEKGSFNLIYHYKCSYENSLLFERPIQNASEKIFPRKEHHDCVWGVNAVREIKIKPERVIKMIDKWLKGTSRYSKWIDLKGKIYDYQAFNPSKVIVAVINWDMTDEMNEDNASQYIAEAFNEYQQNPITWNRNPQSFHHIEERQKQRKLKSLVAKVNHVWKVDYNSDASIPLDGLDSDYYEIKRNGDGNVVLIKSKEKIPFSALCLDPSKLPSSVEDDAITFVLLKDLMEE